MLRSRSKTVRNPRNRLRSVQSRGKSCASQWLTAAGENKRRVASPHLTRCNARMRPGSCGAFSVTVVHIKLSPERDGGKKISPVAQQHINFPGRRRPSSAETNEPEAKYSKPFGTVRTNPKLLHLVPDNVAESVEFRQHYRTAPAGLTWLTEIGHLFSASRNRSD